MPRPSPRTNRTRRVPHPVLSRRLLRRGRRRARRLRAGARGLRVAARHAALQRHARGRARQPVGRDPHGSRAPLRPLPRVALRRGHHLPPARALSRRAAPPPSCPCRSRARPPADAPRWVPGARAALTPAARAGLHRRCRRRCPQTRARARRLRGSSAPTAGPSASTGPGTAPRPRARASRPGSTTGATRYTTFSAARFATTRRVRLVRGEGRGVSD